MGLAIFENFDYEINDLKSLNYSARHLDRFILGAASRSDWEDICTELIKTFDDAKIEEAVKAMPVEVFEISGKKIIQKLKKRRDDLAKYSRDYYHILAKEVDIIGSNEREYFDINRNPDGSVLVQMYDVESLRIVKKEIGYSTKDCFSQKKPRKSGFMA